MYGTVVSRISRKNTKEYSKPKWFRISSIGDCVAKQLFNLAKFPATEFSNPRGGRIFDIGDSLEYLGNQWLKSAGFTIFGKGFKVSGEEPIRTGAIDGFILIDGFAYPYDWKSAANYSFNSLLEKAGINQAEVKKKGYAAYNPREVPNKKYCPIKEYNLTYYYQGQGYMEALAKEKERLEKEDLFPYKLGDGFYFFFVNKDNAALYEEFMLPNPEAIASRLLTLKRGYGTIRTAGRKRFKRPTERLAEKIRKFREYEVRKKGGLDWHCKSCPSLAVCWEKEYPKLVEKEMIKK